jgi:lysophospholipase L1-like esterase
MKKWLGRLFLFLLGLLAAFMALEILSRLFWTRLSELDNVSSISFVSRSDHEKLDPSHFLWPGQVGNIREFSVEVLRNSLGFHDVEHPFAKPEGTFRIIFLGDSFTEAIQVPLEATFPKIIEKELNRKMAFPVETISLGRSGAGTQKSYDILLETGLRFFPDLILMQFLSNDLIDNSPPLKKEEKEQEEYRKKYVPKLEEAYSRYLWVKSSRFNQILALKLARLYQGSQAAKYADQDKYDFIHLNTLVFCEEYSHLWERAWRRTYRFIHQTADLAKQNRSGFLLVSFPEMWRVGSLEEMERRMKSMSRKALDYHWNFDKTDRSLRDFCQKEGIPFLSLLHPFRESYRTSRGRLHFAFDMHLNERGHQVAADAILEYLMKKNMIKIDKGS